MTIYASVIPPTSVPLDVFTVGKGDKGEPGIKWRGDFEPGTPYVAGDGVTDLGSSYVCLSDVDGNTGPADDLSKWQILAAKGQDGGTGTVEWGEIVDRPTTLAGFGIGDGVTNDDPRLTDLRLPLGHEHDWNEITSGVPTTIAGYGITDGVTTARQVLAGTGLTGGGALSADRTLAVSYGSTAGTACQGNDARLSDARTPVAHNQAWITITSTPTTIAGYGITDGVVTTDDRLGVLYGPTTADQTLIGITYTAVTGLQATLAANTTYAFEFNVIADADATATGIDIAVDGPASPEYLYYLQVYWSNATTVVNRPATVYNANTANAGSPGTTRATYTVRGIIRTGASGGNFGPTIKRENVGTGPNVRIGSWGRVTRLA